MYVIVLIHVKHHQKILFLTVVVEIQSCQCGVKCLNRSLLPMLCFLSPENESDGDKLGLRERGLLEVLLGNIKGDGVSEVIDCVLLFP